jgi:hypothetical protein
VRVNPRIYAIPENLKNWPLSCTIIGDRSSSSVGRWRLLFPGLPRVVVEGAVERVPLPVGPELEVALNLPFQNRGLQETHSLVIF